MNSEEHAFLGGLIGLGSYMLHRLAKQKPVNLFEMVVSTIGGAGAAVLPDILEPATEPDHRSIFHSATTPALLSRANLDLWADDGLSEDQKLALSVLSTAYNSHLIADSTTKKGLPLLF